MSMKPLSLWPEAAELLGWDRNKAFAAARAGEIKAAKHGGQWVVDRAEVDRLRETAPTRHLEVSLEFTGRSKPLPAEDPWAEARSGEIAAANTVPVVTSDASEVSE